MKKRIIKIVLPLLSAGFFIACSTKQSVKILPTHVVGSITEFPDSSFFSEISCMQFYNDHIYILDKNRRDVVQLDTTLTKMSVIGSGGPGPKELGACSTFYIYKDTVNIMDYTVGGMKQFYHAEYLSRVICPHYTMSEDRFFCVNGEYVLPAATLKSFGASFYRNDTTTTTYFGQKTFVRSEKQTFIRNFRSFVYDGGDAFYSIAETLPFIEKFNLETKDLVEKYDLSEIEVVKESLNSIKAKNNTNENSVYVLVSDCYLKGKKLFILFNHILEQDGDNVLLVLETEPHLRVSSIYQLNPNNFYDAFCVSDESIYIYNGKKCSIDKIVRIDE
jgi:hypothetical protein